MVDPTQFGGSADTEMIDEFLVLDDLFDGNTTFNVNGVQTKGRDLSLLNKLRYGKIEGLRQDIDDDRPNLVNAITYDLAFDWQDF